MLNSVSLLGRLAQDPELRHTPSGTAVCTFSLAVNRSYTSKQSGERPTDFIDIVTWRSTAEFVSKYFKKGQMAAVHGSIQTRSYTDREGNKRRAFEVVADQVFFADSKGSQNTSSVFQPPVDSMASAPAPAFEMGDTQDFQELENEDLPF